ncbi:hypothetical protein CA54_41730 [Symmachiella macrocystis]|uniref:DUF4185 domain-containing protein n=1 Tax=Symmachiella macrocystis TaxID=2527985 RepID=A0A5C6BEP1_9PLAN|nr:DUF4185 domain-containing protein [Symmachiella macrocystis]TWU08934.1 hypothetical protein CA54_41730 [Symmachiella macrocystis]
MNLSVGLLLATISLGAQDSSEYFKITVLDDQTNRGVPLVELKTVNNCRYYTDSAGVVAFQEPGFMDKTVYFFVSSHGYEFPADRFGFRGTQLKVSPGGSTTIRIKRINVAERLYRVTGGGIYRDSELLGEAVPIVQPVLDARVLGSDSVVNAKYRGRIYWFWGDTNRPSYPLGNFQVPGATTSLLGFQGVDPNRGVSLNYFIGEDGFAKETANMPGKGPTWINGLVTLTDTEGNERMFAKYVKVKNSMTVYERGLVEFNNDSKEFEKRQQFDMKAPLYPYGHPFVHQDGHTEYVNFADPYPLVRVKANAELLQDLEQYETYSCLRQGSREQQLELVRDTNGKLVFEWKKDTTPWTLQIQQELINQGRLNADEAYIHFKDSETGDAVLPSRGSVYWNEFRKKWVMIFVQIGGRSFLGEVWFAEADDLTGPWSKAIRIVTHNKYSFYNPKQHPFFAQEDGRIIYFEGTYTTTFSGNDHPTPRYDYNQIMYRLDLSDPRLSQ